MYKVYGRVSCSWCQRAKDLLKEKGLAFEYIGLDDPATLMSFFEQHPTVPRTVPQIFKDEDYIGGYNDLRASLK